MPPKSHIASTGGFSPAQERALKQRLRALRWQPEAVMREMILIQRLRELAMIEEG